MKKITSLLMSLLLIFSTMSIIAFSATAASTPKLSKTAVTIYYKASTTLKVTGYSKTVKWSSSDTKVAKVSSKGVVTGVALGTTTVTAKAGNKTLKCKVTVKDRNVTASTSFKVTGGGYFINKVSTATAVIKPKKYNAAKVTVYIENAEGTAVYKKTFKNCKKETKYSFEWDGKNTKGNYVPSGSYRMKVVIGKKTSYSDYLSVYAKNYFAGGNGSKSKPFLVATTTQLKSIVRFPNAYYKQTKNLDFEYESVGNFFTADQPFNGVYDGNNKTIKNISANTALFNVIGEKGTIKNLNMKDCNIVGNGASILAKENHGKISNCQIDGVVSVNDHVEGNNANAGFMVHYNYGTISNCTTSGIITGTEHNGNGIAYVGGIVDCNQPTGKIISCISHTEVKAVGGIFDGGCAGGIAATNNGLITGCEADNIVSATDFSNKIAIQGGIAGTNNGQILSSYYTGESNVNIAGKNNGAIA